VAEDLSPVEILDERSSNFPFMSEGAEIPPEEIFLEVRRIDESWQDPVGVEDFPYFEEYSAFATLNGEEGREHLRNYAMGMLRLNLLHHGYTDFAGSDYFEFIDNYEQAEESGAQMPPLTIHGIDSETGEYITTEVPLQDFVITHYVDVGPTFSFDRLNTYQISEDSPELPMYYKTGSTGKESVSGIIIDQENNQVFGITRDPPHVENYFKSYIIQDGFMIVYKLIALPPHIQENIHTAIDTGPSVNGLNLGAFADEIGMTPDTPYGEVYRAERVFALEEHPIQ
jgi:hypothetical protein